MPPSDLDASTSQVARVLFPTTLALTMTASAFQIFAIAVLASPIIDDLDLSRAEIGLVGSLNTAVGALSAPTTGRLTDRIGPRRSVVTVLVLSAIGMALMGTADSIWLLVVASIVSGLPQGWGNPATNSLIATRVPAGRRGGVTGIKQSGVTLGVFLAGATLPAFESPFGWRGASLAFAIAFGVLAVVVQLTLAADPLSAAAADEPGSREPNGPTNRRLDPFVWRLALYALLMGTAGGVTGRFFPLFAEEALGFSLVTAGWLSALGGLIGMAARVYVGRLAESRVRPTTLLLVLATIGATYCLLLAIVTPSSRGLLYLSPPLAAVGIAAWNAVAMLAVITVFSSRQAGRASGVVMLGFLAGVSISAPTAGLVVDRVGEYWPVWVAAAALCVAATVAISGDPRPTPDRAE